jgi:hypothetical protein
VTLSFVLCPALTRSARASAAAINVRLREIRERATVEILA